jgi:5-methylcytosine-specific restriction endonuclease McrA
MTFQKGNKLTLGFKHSDEERKKRSKRMIGNKIWLGRRHSEISKKKMRDYAISIGRIPATMRGKNHTDACKLKMSIDRMGEKSVLWRGGHSEYAVGWTITYKKLIRKRDGYNCCICGKEPGYKANDVHHIDYNKNNHSPNNLITLCKTCHNKTNFNKDYWIKFFREKEAQNHKTPEQHNFENTTGQLFKTFNKLS